jgi:hypothetical protein
MTLTFSPHVSVIETGDGMVLLDERTGEYWQLNATGATVVGVLRAGGTPKQAIARLADEHPAAAGRVGADVARLVESLRSAEVLT